MKGFRYLLLALTVALYLSGCASTSLKDVPTSDTKTECGVKEGGSGAEKETCEKNQKSSDPDTLD